MSGGSLDYFYSSLEDHVGDFKDRELDDLVGDLAQLFHEREWYLSGDTNEGKWREARDAFKRKWFKEDARKERIEKYLYAVKEELLDGLGLSEKYCRNCRYWSAEDDKVSGYGDCDMTKSCLMHRGEKCESFEKRDGEGRIG